MCIRPSSRLVMQRGTYESSSLATQRGRGEGVDGDYEPLSSPPLVPAGYARYLLFYSFGDAFINQMPSSRLVRPRHFSSPSDNIRHAAAGGRCTPLFSSIPAFLTFLLPREPPPFHPVSSHPVSSPRFPHRASHTNVSRWSGWRIRERRDFVKGYSGFREIRFFVRKICLATQILFYKEVFCNIESACEWRTHVKYTSRRYIYGKSKFLIQDRSVSERFRGWKLFSYVCSVKYLYPFSFRYLISLL